VTPVAVLLAAALLAGAGPSTTRARAGISVRTSRLPHRPAGGRDPLAVASSLDVLAVCLTAGMAVPAAAVATAASAPPRLAEILRRAADLLTLGADPAVAWSAPPGARASSIDAQTDALMRLARRSASSGSALAEGVAELSAQCRHDAERTAEATAERAAVLIAGPLGLCFLPAFVCLGIAPVIAGLAGEVLRSGLL
jgi:pilus assembly protein TadC